MAGNDREPIGRKGKPSRPVKQKVSRRQLRDEEYDDDYDDDDYEDEEPMPRKGKGKGKGRKPRGKRGWLWLLLKLAIVFAVLIAIYGVYLDQKIRSRIDGKVWQLPAAVYGRMVNLEPDMTKLTATTGLFFMFSFSGCFFLDRFPVGNLHINQIDINPKFLFQFLRNNFQMHFAQTRYQSLLGFLITADCHGWIFFHQTMKASSQLVDISLCFWFNGHRDNRFWQFNFIINNR